MTFDTEKLQQILENAVDNKKVFGTSFCVKYKGETWCGASGNFERDSQYFIASTTKLFVTAIILKLQHERMLNIEDSISKYLDENTLKSLHVLKGNGYSNTITIRNLLAHTSGLPDYFQQKDASGKSFEQRLTNGEDFQWTFDEVIEYSKSIKPLFPPNAKGKAHYSDTNFQLLGQIIENITQRSISDNYSDLIINPLGLSKTYLYTDITDKKPKTFYFKNKELHIPKAMVSFGPDGGIVSTSAEMLMFIEAFFTGKLFPETYLNTLKVWNRVFFPLESGIGIHRIKLPWFFNPTGKMPELIGHSGLSGALAYHSPERNLFVTGTVNQVANPDTSFKLTFKLLNKIL